MIDIYDGDPKIVITEDGAEIPFPGNGGQPQMEQGVENIVILSLFTSVKWEGNYYFDTKNEKIGSNYEDVSNRPTTISNLELMRKATIDALSIPVFGNIDSEITVIGSGQKKNIITVQPPGQIESKIVLQKNGLNWILQADKGQE